MQSERDIHAAQLGIQIITTAPQGNNVELF